MHQVLLDVLENIPHYYCSPPPLEGNFPFHQTNGVTETLGARKNLVRWGPYVLMSAKRS